MISRRILHPVALRRLRRRLMGSRRQAKNERVKPRRTWRWIVGTIVTGVLAVFGLITGGLDLGQLALERFAAPPGMTGALNIAVAEFTVENGSGSAGAQESGLSIGRNIHKLLQSELRQINEAEGLASLDFVQVWPPDKTGPTPSTVKGLERLARTIKADVIVYGDLKSDRGVTTLAASFHLSGEKFESVQELRGSHRLGPEIESSGLPDNLSTRHNLLRAMQPRVQALAMLIFGFDHDAAGSYRKAAEYFESALAEANQWEESSGKEVMFLSLGNARGNLGNFDAAREAYSEALKANPEYVRAMHGLFETDFQDARGVSCGPSEVNVKLLKSAIDTLYAFESARQLEVADPVSNLYRAKGSYYLGRGYFCLSLAGFDYRQDAQQHFQEVISRYFGVVDQEREPGRPWSNLAAEAHALLAALGESLPGDNGARDYPTAIKEYRLAANLTHDQNRRAGSLLALASVHLRVDECDEALDVLKEAAKVLQLVGQSETHERQLGDMRIRWPGKCQTPFPI